MMQLPQALKGPNCKSAADETATITMITKVVSATAKITLESFEADIV